MKKEEKEITDKKLLEIANRRRRELEEYEPQELQPLNDTPLDRQPKINKGKKAEKSFEENLRKLPQGKYVILENEFIEAIYRQYLRVYESKVLWFLIRKTWGWKKESEFIPLKQFEKELDILRPHISRALSSLIKRRIVTKPGNKRYAIQADTSLWKDKPKKNRSRKRRLPKK